MAGIVWDVTLRVDDGEKTVIDEARGLPKLTDAEAVRQSWIADLEADGYRWYKGAIIHAVYWPPTPDLPVLLLDCRSRQV